MKRQPKTCGIGNIVASDGARATARKLFLCRQNVEKKRSGSASGMKVDGREEEGMQIRLRDQMKFFDQGR